MKLCRRYDILMKELDIEPNCIVNETIREKSLSNSFSENQIGVFPHPAHTQTPFHTHEFFELIYVHRGCCVNLIDKQEVSMQAGDLCLMNPHAYHTLHCSQPEGTVIYNILIGTAVLESPHFQMFSRNDFVEDFFLQSFQRQHQQDNYVLFQKTEVTAAAIALSQQIIEEYYERKEVLYQQSKLVLLFDCLLIELVRGYQTQHNLPLGIKTPNQRISDVIQFMAEHCDHITLDSLSAQFSYHPKHFSRIIRQATGRSFSDLLIDIRMQRAKKLLSTSRLPITEVMRQVGYQNYTWFTRQFKKQFGFLPSACPRP